MNDKKLIRIDELSDNLISNLDSRDVVLWIRSLPKDFLDKKQLVTFLGLPWKLVILEVFDPTLIKDLEAAASFNDPMTRRRGFIQIVDSDPSRIELPQRCLPIYLLNGRQPSSNLADFEARLRRMTMLECLRRSNTREMLIVSADDDPIPPDLRDLWSSGFRSFVTFNSVSSQAYDLLTDWLTEAQEISAANFLSAPISELVRNTLERYSATYPEDRHVVRVRDREGTFYKVDITDVDEPERPILEWYSLIQERDLSPLTPEELAQDDFIGFFRNPEDSWRPYAAGLPWMRDTKCKSLLSARLRRLDIVGSAENCIAYISSESGAGGTTLARALAWECAREGYPVLLAKSLSFVPDALSVINFLTRAHRIAEVQITKRHADLSKPAQIQSASSQDESPPRRYETPWIIVFDSLHWESRDGELLRFRNEITKAGRSVCILVVTGTVLGLSFFNTSVFKAITTLTHAMDQEEARELGRHLNKYLRLYGMERKDYQWDQFYKEHTVRYLEGISAFWVTLSFWIQRQYDLSESIQTWIFRKFKENITDKAMQNAVLEIAVLSSERLPLPEVLLPTSGSKWPISHVLDDNRSSLSALGLVRIVANGEKYWALVHDILGRFLINALFYDFAMRDELGFADAKDAEHLRFLLLRQISQKHALGERAYRAIGEDFATLIFKVDPDHGRGNFAAYWRQVLAALDSMPKSLRDTSRLFRHHMAISRRRIAKLDESLYGVAIEDRICLLNGAIDDINYALTFIEYSPGSDSNLNLYNSLANAYLDLAEVEAVNGSSQTRILELRKLANDATRKAYGENPTNSFVIETYVKNLLEHARTSQGNAIDDCVEALGILFSAMNADEAAYRKAHLGVLADQALATLFEQSPINVASVSPSNAIEVLIQAWKLLADGFEFKTGMTLSDAPAENRVRALIALEHPAGIGNMQVIRLSYDLICIERPQTFKQQLDLVEQLQATDYKMTPQLQLEYAILLFQNSRAVEGDKKFRQLRQIWRDSEQFVHIPARLRWMRQPDSDSLQTVQATVGSDYGGRALARVQEFGNALVPFRPEEFGFRDLRPGIRFACHVSFGHNGPFLRPTTAYASRDG